MRELLNAVFESLRNVVRVVWIEVKKFFSVVQSRKN